MSNRVMLWATLATASVVAGCDCGAGSAGDGGLDSGLPTQEEYCSGEGPAVVVNPGNGAADGGVCTGELAAGIFRAALCACEFISVQDALQVDGYDSRLGPYTPAGAGGGAVATNGSYENTNITTIGGSLVIGGSAPAILSSVHVIRGDLWVGGSLVADDDITVDRNAYVNGDIDASGSLTVTGELHVPVGSVRTGAIAAGSIVEEDVTVPSACDCDPAQLVDISGLIAARQSANHNANVGLDPQLLDPPASSVNLDLPCGEFSLSAIDTGSNSVVINISGRTALYVQGDITVENPLTINLVGDDSELDLFVGGTIEATSALVLGSPDRPRSVRIYVAGTADIIMSSGATLYGFLYAPFAQVRPADGVTVFGAIFCRSFFSTGAVSIHYDRAILGAGADCSAPPPTTCQVCQDCGAGLGCVAGACAACQNDSDCCAPLVCTAGACVPLSP